MEKKKVDGMLSWLEPKIQKISESSWALQITTGGLSRTLLE